MLPAINGAKCVLTLHTCIFVADRVNIIKQNNSIVIHVHVGPLYVQSEFEAMGLLLPKGMTGSYPVGYRTLQYWHGASARPPKHILP